MLMVAMRSLERAICLQRQEAARRLDGQRQAHVAGGDAAGALQALDLRDDRLDLRGRLGLGDRQAVEARVDGGIDVIGEQGGIVVHAHQHLGATPAGDGQGALNELPRAGLLLGRHRVLEVEDDGVGTTGEGLLHETRDVDRQDQRRATGAGNGHGQMTPFWVSAAMRSSE